MAVFRPTKYCHRLIDVTIEQLKQMQIHTLLLDVDNTLSTHHNPQPAEGIVSWINAAKEEGIRMMIVSNSRQKRVEPFAASLGLDFFSLCKKPLPFRLNRAIRAMEKEKSGILLCGDQVFTDLLAGKLCRIKTLLLDPIEPETGWSFRLRRFLEQPIRNKYKENRT